MGGSVSTLTIRGVDEQALDELRRQAGSAHSSMNKFLVEALRKVASPSVPGKVREWHDLDGFFGSWSEEDAREVMQRCGESGKVDAEIWK
jgi:hypothetical protein